MSRSYCSSDRPRRVTRSPHATQHGTKVWSHLMECFRCGHYYRSEYIKPEPITNALVCTYCYEPWPQQDFPYIPIPHFAPDKSWHIEPYDDIPNPPATIPTLPQYPDDE